MDRGFDTYAGIFDQMEGLGSKAVDQFGVLTRLMNDRDVPARHKIVPVLSVGAAVWLVKHEGIIPDKVPYLGKLDNITLAGLALYAGVKIFELLAPAESVAKAWREVNEQRTLREAVVGAAKAGTPTGRDVGEGASSPAWTIKE